MASTGERARQAALKRRTKWASRPARCHPIARYPAPGSEHEYKLRQLGDAKAAVEAQLAALDQKMADAEKELAERPREEIS